MALVEPKLPNDSFETLTRYMTGRLGRFEKVRQRSLGGTYELARPKGSKVNGKGPRTTPHTCGDPRHHPA